MANLGSPGVQVNVIDESFYTPAAPGTVPLIFVASASNKANASATGTAQGTLNANAGTVYVITSQRDLTDTFGTPYFETDTTGNPVHASEISEYGLQAAYSLLGVSSQAYIVRANIDLGQLDPTASAPEGSPTAGTYWVDTSNTKFGINEWDAAKKTFTVKTPLIINNDNMDAQGNALGTAPGDQFGKQGDYAMFVTSDNGTTYPMALYYKTSANTDAWVKVTNGFDGGKKLVVAPHTQYPDYTSAGLNATTGSIWVKTTTPGNGANWDVKYYNGSTSAWTSVSTPVYSSTTEALYKFDSAGGGKNINVGSVFIETDPDQLSANGLNAAAEFRAWRRSGTGATSIVSGASSVTTTTNSTFSIRETLLGSAGWSATATITIPPSASVSIGQQLATQVNLSALVNVSASYDSVTKKVTIKHALGGDIELVDREGTPLARSGFGAYSVDAETGIASGTRNLYAGPTGDTVAFGTGTVLHASNWNPLVFEATSSAPMTTPDNGTLWFDSNISAVDIMYHDGNNWTGYRNAFPNTDPNGPIVAAIAPPAVGGQSMGGNLVTGDIWVSSAIPDEYGQMISIWDGVNSVWVEQDVTDHHTPNGWVFTDVRWATTGTTLNASAISDLLLSDYVDPDAPDPALYPAGTRLWNTRRSGNNVKKYVMGHVDITANDGLNVRYPFDVNGAGESMATYATDRWVTVDGNNANGTGRFGRWAQRGVVTAAFKAMIDTNTAIRDTETLKFNLIACPGYPEAIQNMIAFNTNIGQTAMVIGDTPFRLAPTGTALNSWGNNTMLALDNGEEGAVSHDEYLAMYYPSGYTNDNKGKSIVVPPSHMMLRTIVNSDAVSYEWFAPAGTNRGVIDNATSVGYVNSDGQFKTVSLYQSLRDVLQAPGVNINPIATLTGVGNVVMGQKTRASNSSALDRINVVRLVAYLRRQLGVLSKPYLFEPNDQQTRNEIKGAIESLMLELVGQRALYDFIVVCDSTNNTPTRIDRSELWVDIAIEPVKAVEFIYIPLRILNTGAIAAGNYGSFAA